MDATIFVALIAFMGQITLAIMQNNHLKAQTKKTRAETSEILIDKALNISKQENEALRLLNETLRKELDCCKEDCYKQENTIDKLKEQLEVCRDTIKLLEEEIETRRK